MKITRHKTSSMFKRYADLFSDEEQRAQQRAAQNRRREWKKAQAATVVTIPTRDSRSVEPITGTLKGSLNLGSP